MKVIGCSSVDFALGDRPESWTLCTTFKYAFLDLDDWLVELSPLITLISPSGGRDDSSALPFSFSSLWSRPRKLFSFPYLIRFSTFCFRPKHSSVVSMEATILTPIALIGISLHFLRPLQGWIVFDLHKNLLKWYIQWGILLIPC